MLATGVAALAVVLGGVFFALPAARGQAATSVTVAIDVDCDGAGDERVELSAPSLPRNLDICVSITQADPGIVAWQVKVSGPPGWTFTSVAEERSWSEGIPTVCPGPIGEGTSTVLLACALLDMTAEPLPAAPQVIARLSAAIDPSRAGQSSTVHLVSLSEDPDFGTSVFCNTTGAECATITLVDSTITVSAAPAGTLTLTPPPPATSMPPPSPPVDGTTRITTTPTGRLTPTPKPTTSVPPLSPPTEGGTPLSITATAPVALTATPPSAPLPSPSPSTGRIADLADEAGSPDAPSDSSSRNYGVLAGVLAAVTAGAVAIVGGVWYARRRWLK